VEHSRRRSFRRITSASVAASGSVTLPAVLIPSPPFLDESAQASRFRRVTLMAAGITNGSTAASDWSLVVKVTFQPTKEGPPGVFTIPAASSSNLSFIYDALALPGASFQITATNGHGSAADTITMNYGAMASPTWVEPDHEAIEP
jgi:hypothetical protein